MAPDELEHIFNRFYRCDEARQLDHAGAQDVLTTSHFERMRDGAISVNAVGMDVDAGAVSAYAALLAERSGFRALYLSGAGVTDSVFGLPDLGMTTLTEVARRRRVASVPPPISRFSSTLTQASGTRSAQNGPKSRRRSRQRRRLSRPRRRSRPRRSVRLRASGPLRWRGRFAPPPSLG